MKANCKLKSSHKYSSLCPYRGSKPTFLIQVPDWVHDPCSSDHFHGCSLSPALTFKPSCPCSSFKPFLPQALAHWVLYSTCPSPGVPRSALHIISGLLLQNQAISTPLLWFWARATVLSGLDNCGPLCPEPVDLCCLDFQNPWPFLFCFMLEVFIEGSDSQQWPYIGTMWATWKNSSVWALPPKILI